MSPALPEKTPVNLPKAYDLEACRALMRGGSKSFFAASKLLPVRLRAPASALYAYCRLADDAIDDIQRRVKDASEVGQHIRHAHQVMVVVARATVGL